MKIFTLLVSLILATSSWAGTIGLAYFDGNWNQNPQVVVADGIISEVTACQVGCFDVTFSEELSDLNYTVPPPSTSTNGIFGTVSNRTTTGFQIQFHDIYENRQNPAEVQISVAVVD